MPVFVFFHQDLAGGKYYRKKGKVEKAPEITWREDFAHAADP